MTEKEKQNDRKGRGFFSFAIAQGHRMTPFLSSYSEGFNTPRRCPEQSEGTLSEIRMRFFAFGSE
jgi:hypothetical protein